MKPQQLKTLVKAILKEVMVNERIQDPPKTEMMAYLKSQYGNEEGWEDNAEVAIYWFANFYHGGQWSNLYSALSTSPFSPGPIARGPEKDSMEEMMYRDLVYQFAGGEGLDDKEEFQEGSPFGLRAQRRNKELADLHKKIANTDTTKRDEMVKNWIMQHLKDTDPKTAYKLQMNKDRLSTLKGLGMKEAAPDIQNPLKQTQTDIYSKLEKMGFHENGNEPRIYMEYYRYNFATIQCSVNVPEKNVRIETYYDSERINDEKAKVYTIPIPETYSQDFADKIVLACSRLKKSIDGDEPIFGGIDDINESLAEVPGATSHLINGQSNNVAASRVNKVLASISKGLFSDNSWEAIHKIFNKLQELGLDVTVESAKYGGHADTGTGMPKFKEWQISIPFTNKNGRPSELVGTITAHGAGSVEQPLDKYDITAYVSAIPART